MADFAMLGGQRWGQFASVAASSRGEQVTSGTANVKSTNWVEIENSTAFASDGILVILSQNTATDCLLDLAVGTAGNEVIIAANLGVSWGTGASSGARYYLPIKIPSGTRLSCKSQTTLGSTVVHIQVLGWQAGMAPSSALQTIDTYGAATADSGGTSIDPGGTANTKPSTWTEIVASTTRRHQALMLYIGNQVNTARAAARWLVDIAVGASTSEQAIITNITLSADTAKDTVMPLTIGPLPCDIPMGTRLSMRAQCSITDATDRLFDAVLYGVG